MRIKPALASILGLLLSVAAFSQSKSISVNNYTGSLNVAIPLYNITSGSLSMPVTAVYQTNGVKVKDIKAELGMNWHLVAGGEISRQVRGLPDDIKKDNASNARLGWLYNTNGAKINAFTIANDNNPAVCTDETADNNYITTNFSDLSDTEPDIFNVNAPGLSCQFVFDNGHLIKTIPYQDLKITYDADPTTGAILQFTVVNDKGVTYEFGSTLISNRPGPSLFFEQETRKATSSGTVSYLKRAYDQYINGITFTKAWKLTMMSSFNGGSIGILYGPGVKKAYDTPVSLVLPGASSASIQYTINKSWVPLLMANITGVINSTVSRIDFTASANKYTYITGMGRYTTFSYDIPNTAGTDRAFLKSIIQEGSGVNSSFGFDYNRLTHASTGAPASVNLPDSTSRQIDYWGYYNAGGATSLIPQMYINPSNTPLERYRSVAPGGNASSYPYTISGTARDASLSGAVNGSLSKIWSIAGDTTTVEYELNDFYDNTAGAVTPGGGIRVKKITAFDGFNAANNIVTNYSYLNPSTNISSGRAITIPVYAFTTPYTGSGTDDVKWMNSTVRSEEDLSDEDESVVYNYVKVSSTAGGNILYEYSVPATNWDNSALPDWAPTIVYSGRISCGAATFANNQTNNYPYPPNPNFDFERGLLKKMSTFNEAGQPTSEESYTYQRSYATPTLITGFKFDNNTSSARNYAKYNVFAGTSELLVQQTKKVFDLPALTSFQTATTTYNYAGTAHKLLTSTATTNSDGSITRNFIRYVKDYNTMPGTDSMANGLYRLKQANANFPIEQYQQLQNSSGTVTTGAGLTRYSYFGLFQNSAKPSQSLQLVSPNGLSDFLPSGIVSNVFRYDSRYIIKSNYLAYDSLGVLQSVDNNRHQAVTTFTDFTRGQPFAIFKNALAKEVAFDDFDNKYTRTGFNYTNITQTPNDRNGLYAITIIPSSVITDTITKSGLVSNYIFSIWTKNSGSIAIQVTDGTHTNNVTLISSAYKWQYQEIKVPVNNLNATFKVKLTPSTDILVDDVLFYPENAQAGTIAYDPCTYVKLAETNTNGISAYYDYDSYGRPRNIYDQDRNIVKRIINFNAATVRQTEYLFIEKTVENYNNPSKFTAHIDSILTREGMTFTWDFGDGSAPVTTKELSIQHIYRSSATFVATLTRNSPVYATRTDTVHAMVPDFSGTPCRLIAGGLPGADVTGLQVYLPDGTPVGSYSQADLLSGIYTIRQGIYNIVVSVNGTIYNPSFGTGYRSIQINIADPPGSQCQNRGTKLNPVAGYNFRVDLNGSSQMGIGLTTGTCTIP